MGASQRRKGAAGEREWVDVLRRAGYPVEGRQLGQARDGGGDVRYGGVLFEVKRYNKIAVRKWLDQAEASVLQYKQGEIATVVMREDGRTQWMVLMSGNDFLNLLERAEIFHED